jgi:glucokinase
VRIGVDIGGSGVRAARVQGGAFASEIVARPLVDRSPARVLDAVADAIAPLGPAPVGVGVPGFVHRGVVLGSPNFPGWEGYDLQAALHARLGVPVAVGNDANVAALGAWAERGGDELLVLLTLGTGVGGGVVVDGRPLVGAGGTGAELGHLFVGGARRCGCGGVGCLETWCGTVGLCAAARERGVEVADGETVVAAADAGEPWALEVLAGAALHLGRALVSLVNVFNPDVVVIAGGLAAARRHLVSAEDHLRVHGVPPSVARARIVWGGRAERWAILGAAAQLGEDR